VLGGVASFAGTGWTFGVDGVASLGLVAFAAGTSAAPPEEPQPLSSLFAAFRDRRLLVCFWLVALPGLLFGNLSVLVPLRLSHLGYGGAAIGAVFLCSAALEAGNNILVGRVSDRHGTSIPILTGLGASAVLAALLPWPNDATLLAVLVVLASLAFGAFFTPALTLLTNVSEARGLDYGYAFALVNLAWAPGETFGAAGGGGLAHATADAIPYLALSVICIASFALLGRLTSRA
jgi:predicted MFS family arabinose efflux permease